MFILAQLSIWNLHSTSVSFLYPSQNSAAGNPLLTANGIARMLAVILISKRLAVITKALGFFDLFSC